MEKFASRLAREVAALDPAERTRFAIVLPLAPGKGDAVQALLSDGPPFDAEQLGLDGHEVYRTADEAIFVFQGARGLTTLGRMLDLDDFWAALSAWEQVAAAPPRAGA